MNYSIGDTYEFELDGEKHTGTITDMFVMAGKLYFKVKKVGLYTQQIEISLP